METLYKQHAGMVHAYALRSTGQPHLADEIVQETFIRAFKGVGRFSGRSTFKTWLFSIAMNCTRTQLRRAPRSEVSLEEERLLTQELESKSWEQARLQRALDALPQGYREVVVMHDVLGMEHQEIAEHRRCTAGTSKSQLHKARAKLRDLLKRKGPHDD